VCQSPNFRESFMIMALSYNPETRITSGFCGYTSQNAENATLIRNLKHAKSNAYHPMLLPALTYGIFWDQLRAQIKDVRVIMQDVQDKTGVLKNYLKLSNVERGGDKEETGYSKKAEAKPDYDLLHERIVSQQAQMTNSLAEFVSDLGPACHNALSTIRNCSSRSDDSSGSDNDTEASVEDEELQRYVQYLHGMAKIELQYRDQLLSRVNMQIKVVRTCQSFHILLL
jgi:hypothetical protein